MRAAATGRAALTAGGLALLAAAAPGCGGGGGDYPVTLAFPPRADRLVLKLPTAAPAGTGQPGKLDEELAGLDAVGGKTADPATVPADRRAELTRFLLDTFGTPAAPVVAGESGPAAAALGLTPERLAEGGRLYRRHCLQCHGLPGDGRGPTGPWIDPHPRDFRRGAFKFVSAGDGMKPRPADLARTIRDGLPGTAMPAFGLLPDDDRDRMAAYVTYLSVRGQVEFQTLAALLSEDDDTDGDTAAFAAKRLAAVLADWQRAADTPARPAGPPPGFDARTGPDHDAAVRRGFALFTEKSGAGCLACHEDYGRKATYRFDAWGTVVKPADLTAGGYKGGGTAVDLYHRVRSGIQPAGMPAHPALSESQAWDVVRFVRSLPFPRELPDDVRPKVYPGQ